MYAFLTTLRIVKLIKNEKLDIVFSSNSVHIEVQKTAKLYAYFAKKISDAALLSLDKTEGEY